MSRIQIKALNLDTYRGSFKASSSFIQPRDVKYHKTNLDIVSHHDVHVRGSTFQSQQIQHFFVLLAKKLKNLD